VGIDTEFYIVIEKEVVLMYHGDPKKSMVYTTITKDLHSEYKRLLAREGCVSSLLIKKLIKQWIEEQRQTERAYFQN